MEFNENLTDNLVADTRLQMKDARMCSPYNAFYVFKVTTPPQTKHIRS